MGQASLRRTISVSATHLAAVGRPDSPFGDDHPGEDDGGAEVAADALEGAILMAQRTYAELEQS